MPSFSVDGSGSDQELDDVDMSRMTTTKPTECQEENCGKFGGRCDVNGCVCDYSCQAIRYVFFAILFKFLMLFYIFEHNNLIKTHFKWGTKGYEFEFHLSL